MKKTPFFLFFVLGIILGQISGIMAYQEVELQYTTKAQTISAKREIGTTNFTNIDNYQNMYARNGSINFIGFDYGNCKDKLSYSGNIDSQFNIINNTDYNGNNFTSKSLNINQTNSGYNPSLYCYAFDTSSFQSTNISIIFKPNSSSLYFNCLIVKNTTNYFYYRFEMNYEGHCRIGMKDYSDASYTFSSYITVNYNYPLYINMYFNKDSLNAICELRSLYDGVNVSLNYIAYSYIPYNLVYLQLQFSTSSKQSLNLFAIDSNYNIHFNANVSSFDVLHQLDSGYSNNRILQIYDVNDKSFESFDYVSKGYPYNVIEFNSSDDYDVTYEQVPTMRHYREENLTFCDFRTGWGYVNAANITFNEEYSEVEIRKPLQITNTSNFLVSCAFDLPVKMLPDGYPEFEVEICIDNVSWGFLDFGGIYYYMFFVQNNYRRYYLMDDIYKADQRETIVMQFGKTPVSIANTTQTMFMSREYNWLTTAMNVNFTADSDIRIKVRNSVGGGLPANGSSHRGSLLFEGLWIENNPSYVNPSGLFDITPSVMFESKRLCEFNETQTIELETPTLVGHNVYYEVCYEVAYSLSYGNNCLSEWSMDVIGTNKTENIFWNVSDFDVGGYSFNFFKYGQYGNFSLNSSEDGKLYGYESEYLEYSVLLSLYWYFYTSALPDSIFQTMFELLAPFIIVFIFPFVMYQLLGKKGVGVGFALGFLITGFAGMISMNYAIILTICSIMLAVIIWKYKEEGGNSE